MPTARNSKVFTLELNEVKRLSSAAMRELLKAVLDRGQQFRFRAAGMSMFPFIRNGDVVTVSPLQGEEPGIGDIVAFLQNHDRSLALHRVVGVEHQSRVTRGDGVLHADGRIPCENILGMVVRIERRGREVRLGIGPERRAIALLSRLGISGGIASIALKAIALARRRAVPKDATPESDNQEGT